MRTALLSLPLVVFLLCPLMPAQSRLLNTDIPAGPVSGIWTRAGSPYHITGEITVPNDSTLLIEPGVEVVFFGHYKLNVQGRLLAVGTQQDSIHFRSADVQAGWHGIRFDGTASTNDTSKIVYSVLRNGKANTGSGFDRCGGAIMIREFDKVLVSGCLLDANLQSGEEMTPVPTAGPAVYVYQASPTIANSTFSHNSGSKGSAIACVHSPKAIISNNTLFKNIGGWVAPIVTYGIGSPVISGNLILDNVAGLGAGGISVEFGASPLVENNIVIRNRAPGAAGIMCYTSACPILLNNTIAFNTATTEGGGIGCYYDSDPILINNIIYGNTAPVGHQVSINEDDSDPVFFYCDIQGGKQGFGGVGAGPNYTGQYVFNIDANPMFVNPSSDDYRLSDSSLCIGAGVDSVEVSGVWYYVPRRCFGGIPRPSPIPSRPDIGACENLRGTPVVGVAAEGVMPAKYLLHQNYPNPFNPSATIKYELLRASQVNLSVFDILGHEVSVLVNERRDAGVHEVKFDASGLSSGVYFYRLQAGDFTRTKRLLLIQ
jgi:hypothetical protein